MWGTAGDDTVGVAEREGYKLKIGCVRTQHSKQSFLSLHNRLQKVHNLRETVTGPTLGLPTHV